MNGIRDIKRTRDTIVVTGSAHQPIEANLAEWYVSVSSRELTPAGAARALHAKTAAVEKFLRAAGLSDAVTKPPLEVEQTSIQVPTGLKKPRFRSIPAWRILQTYNLQTTKIDTLVKTAASVDTLLLRGVIW